MLRLFDDYDIRVTLGVVPKVRGWRLDDNRSILKLLERAKADGHELALHGVEHDRHEFERLPLDEGQCRLSVGQRLMQEWFGEPAETFIPPDNAWPKELLGALADVGIRTLSSGSPLNPLPEMPLLVVDAVARFRFMPLIALIRYLANLSLPHPLPLVIYFHSWELKGKPHWEWFESLLRTITETPGVMALTFTQGAQRFPEAFHFWVKWRRESALVRRWNEAFRSRPFYRARMWHGCWRDLRGDDFPNPILERWMVQAYTAALTGAVSELECLVAKLRDGLSGTNLPETTATLVGWGKLAVAGGIWKVIRSRPLTKMEEAFRVTSSQRLAPVASRDSLPVPTHLNPTDDALRSLVYLSFDRHLISEHTVMTSKALAKRGWRVTLVHPQGALWGASLEGLRRVEVGAGLKRGLWDQSAQREMARLIAYWKPPFIYARQHWTGLLPLLIARRLGIPYVAEFNGLRHRGILARDRRSLKGYLIRFWERLCARWGTAVVVPSRPLAERLRELMNDKPEIYDLKGPLHGRLFPTPFPPIFIIPNGVDPDIFCPMSQGEVRRRLGLPAEGLYVAYTGSLHIWQGVDVLLRAFARLLGRFPHCRLLIVGGQDEPNKDAYRRLAHELGISDDTFFIPFVPYERSAFYIAAADVCVAPYLWSYREHGGGSPLKLYAYLSCGRPVVLSDLGAFVDADLVRNSGAGVLVPPGDVEALTEALASLLSNADRRTEMGQRGREAILNGYTWEHNAMRIERVLEAIKGGCKA